MGIYLQGWFPSVPAQVFQVAPFPLMIFTLLIINFIQSGSVLNRSDGKGLIRSIIRIFSGEMPAALGKPYTSE